MVKDGDFLIRESTSKSPGQFVLTGMAGGIIGHLLLVDKEGKVIIVTLLQNTYHSTMGGNYLKPVIPLGAESLNYIELHAVLFTECTGF